MSDGLAKTIGDPWQGYDKRVATTEQVNEYLKEECERYRAQVTSWKDLYECSSAKNEAVFTGLKEDLTAAQARIAELEDVLKQVITTDSPTYGVIALSRVREALLSRKSNLDALEAYRDGVIEECALLGDKWPDYNTQGLIESIRALKKGVTP